MRPYERGEKSERRGRPNSRMRIEPTATFFFLFSSACVPSASSTRIPTSRHHFFDIHWHRLWFFLNPKSLQALPLELDQRIALYAHYHDGRGRRAYVLLFVCNLSFVIIHGLHAMVGEPLRIKFVLGNKGIDEMEKARRKSPSIYLRLGPRGGGKFHGAQHGHDGGGRMSNT